MSRKLLVSGLVTFALLLGLAQTAHAADAIGNPSSVNGWSTTSVVAVKSNASSYGCVILRVINGSGLDSATGLLHSAQLWNSPDMWYWHGNATKNVLAPNITSPAGTTCKTWIQFTFTDQIYPVGSMWVWNGNFPTTTNSGLKNISVYYATTDPNTAGSWTKLGDYVLAQGTGLADLPHGNDIAFGGVNAKYVLICATTNYGFTSNYDDYSLSEVRFYQPPPSYATSPNPSDTAADISVFPVLSWMKGLKAASTNGHRVYFGTNYNTVNTATTGYIARTDANYSPSELRVSTTYYWRVDEVNTGQVGSPWKGNVWNFTTNSGVAANPRPAHNVTLNATRVTLSWTAGQTANSHNIYFGTNFADVNTATTGYVNRIDPNYTIPYELDYQTTYFWRIDEKDNNGPTCRGPVWRFTTWDGTGLVAWWKFDDPDPNGLTVLDSSGNGYNATISHGDVNVPPYWVAGNFGGAYNFNYKDEAVAPGNTMDGCTDKLTMAFWLKNPDGYDDVSQGIAPFSSYKGGGYAVNCAWLPDSQLNTGTHGAMKWYCGQNWSVVQGVTSDPNDYKGNWNHWALTKNSNAGTLKMYLNGQLFASTAGQPTPYDWPVVSNSVEIGTYWTHANGWAYNIDDFRIYSSDLAIGTIQRLIPGMVNLGKAWSPSPSDGDSGIVTNTKLHWSAGDYAVSHRVYIGTSWADVNSATGGYATTTSPIYQHPSGLSLNTTYYWRIDEVNSANPQSPWKGDIWNFTTISHLDLENFEAYADTNDLDAAWVGNPADEPGYTYVNLDTDVMNGGSKAMRLENWTGYPPYFIEAKYTFATNQNWATNGIKILSLWIRGDAGNTINEPIYVKLTDAAATPKTVTVTCPIAGADTNSTWQQWYIDLTAIGSGSLDKTNIKSVTVGNGGLNSGDLGTVDLMYVDDIQLYTQLCILEHGPGSADLNEDCSVDTWDLGILQNDWLATAYSFTVAAPSDTNLTAWWKLDETSGSTANDSTSGAHNCIISGASAWVAGAPSARGNSSTNKALDFQASGYLNPPLNAIADVNNAITVAWWQYWRGPTSGYTYAYIFAAEATGGWSIAANTMTDGFYFSAGWDSWLEMDSINARGYTASDLYNKWIHVAMTKDCATGVMSVYIDGIRQAVVTGMTRPIHGDQMSKFKIGIHSWAWAPYFDGILDDIRIYNSALTQPQCAYIAGLSGTVTQPLQGQAALTDTALVTDSTINFKDFAKLANYWLEKKLWP